MSIYKNVQFISWEVYTGPEYMTTSANKPEAVEYSGIRGPINEDWRKDALNQCIDIDARVAFTKDAIEKAWSSSLLDKSEDTLKIFMAPEFLYRGPAGAYIHDLVTGWAGGPKPNSIELPPGYSNWTGLLEKLKEIVCEDKYKAWLFIFGTAVGAHFPWDEKNEVILDSEDDPGIICNISLIQPGGSSNRNKCCVAQKYHKSTTDFVQFKKDIDINRFIYKDDTSEHLKNTPLISKDILGYFDIYGDPVFSFYDIRNPQSKEIKFGIEICLDHACMPPEQQVDGTLQNVDVGMLKFSNKSVDIQLVPSCGMYLQEDSISLCQEQPGSDPNLKSYAFNCDGLTGDYMGEINGAHTQIWDGAVPRNKNNFSNDFKNGDTSLIKVVSNVVITVYDNNNIEQQREINADELWHSLTLKERLHYNDFITFMRNNITDMPKGSGYIRVTPPVPL